MYKNNRRSHERGIAHAFLALVVVVVLVGILGFVGYNAWQRKETNAAGTSSLGNTTYVYNVETSVGCNLAGRVWSNNKCNKTCQAGSYKTRGTVGYCAGSIDTAQGEAECKGLARKYVKSLGCAKLSVFPDKFHASGRGFMVDAKQCLSGYRVYLQNTRDYCTKGAGADVSGTRDRTKPKVLAATTMMQLSGQYQSIDPRTGYSFSQQATYWANSRRVADGLYTAKFGIGDYPLALFGTVTKNNWKQAEAFLKKQTNGNMYGLWRWTNEDSSDNLFNGYDANKPFKKINTASFTYNEAECQRSISKYGYCDYSPMSGYNPNYFSSAAEQAAWVKKYNVSITPTKYGPVNGKMQSARIVTGWGHTNASGYMFKYSDGTSPGFTGTSFSTSGTSPFKQNRPLY